MEESKTAKYVRMIARKGGISSAAAELGVSQPTLSVALKKAEKNLGFSIFDRSTTPLTLTDAGRAYLDYADDVASLRRELVRKVSDLEDLQCGELVVGGVGTFNLVHLPRAVAAFSEQYPNIDIYVVDGNAPEMAREALEGKIDVLIAPLMENDGAFEYKELMRERIFLCVPPEWPVVDRLPAIGDEGFASIGKDDFDLLRDQVFISMHDDQVMGKKLKALLEENGIKLKRIIQSSQLLTCLALTMKGVGISIMTESALSYARPEKAPALYLPDSDICTRVLYVARPKNRHVSVAARRFIEILEQTMPAGSCPAAGGK